MHKSIFSHNSCELSQLYGFQTSTTVIKPIHNSPFNTHSLAFLIYNDTSAASQQPHYQIILFRPSFAAPCSNMQVLGPHRIENCKFAHLQITQHHCNQPVLITASWKANSTVLLCCLPVPCTRSLKHSGLLEKLVLIPKAPLNSMTQVPDPWHWPGCADSGSPLWNGIYHITVPIPCSWWRGWDRTRLQCWYKVFAHWIYVRFGFGGKQRVNRNWDCLLPLFKYIGFFSPKATSSRCHILGSRCLAKF